MAEQDITDWDVTEAMIQKGGSFVADLGRAWRLADPSNQDRLKAAFPDYWATYTDWAVTIRDLKDHG